MLQLSLFDVAEVTTAKTKTEAPLLQFSNKKIPTGVLSLLESATVEKQGDRWELEIPHTTRSIYEGFKKVLSALRGEWDGKTHRFGYDPTDAIAQTLQTKKFPEVNPAAFFPTPREVVIQLLHFMDFATPEDFENRPDWKLAFDDPDSILLEPSAGTGSIVRTIREIYPHLTVEACELDPLNRSILQQQGVKLVGRDFLSAPLEPKYRWVIMNPPFNGNGSDYIDHITRAFNLLERNGELGAIVPSGMLFKSDRRTVDFRNFVATYGSWELLDKGAFEESGTEVQCALIKLTRYDDSYIRRQESEKHNGYKNWWVYRVLLELENDGEYDSFRSQVVSDLHKGRISKEDAKQKIGERMDSYVSLQVRKGWTHRWDSLIRNATISEEWENIEELVSEVLEQYIYPADHLRSLPTIQKSHFEDLKIQEGSVEVWISRCRVEDGEPYNNRVRVVSNGISYEYEAE